MPEETAPAKPGRNLRGAVLWTAGIVLALGLAWFAAYWIAALRSTHEVLGEVARGACSGEEAVRRLGGPGRAVARLSLYLRLPARWADRKGSAIWPLELCGRPAVPALVRALGSPDLYVRKRAAAALGKIGPDSAGAGPELAAALAEPDDELRCTAAWALGRIGPAAEAAARTLIGALKVPPGYHRRWYKWDVPRYAAWALGRIGPAAAPGVPDLIKLLAFGGETGRNAAYALGRIGRAAEDAVPALVKALGDEDAQVRAAAAIALGQVGPAARAAVPALEARLMDRSEAVREEVELTLQQLRGEEPPR